ncbi:MAG: DUF192 domain-containing protein [Patescibacteria group bacterium]
MIKRICVVSLFLIALFFLGNYILKANEYKKATIIIKDKIVLADAADTPYKLSKGLSGRENLAENQGMIFIFAQNGFYSFWMKKMNFPLDIIWIRDNKIVEIIKNASVPTDNNIPIYKPQNEANMVLEVNHGAVDKYNWQIGDSVQIDFDR